MPSVSIPTALSIAGAASGVASAASGIMGAGAAKSAGATQANAANNSVQLQQQMFNTIQGNLNPFIQAGQGAIPMLNGLLGTGGPGPGPGGPGAAAPAGSPASGPLTGSAAAEALGPTGGLFSGKGNSAIQDIQQALIKGLPISDASWAKAGLPPGGGDVLNPKNAQGGTALPGQPGGNPLGATPFDPMSFLEQTPGYQFTKQQGLQGTQNSYASHGLAQSGAALKGAAEYSTNLASTTYETRLQDYFKLLEGGQSAALGLGQVGTGTAQSIGNTMTSGAAATAAGTVGSANALGAGITGVAGAGGNIALAQALKGTGMFGAPGGNGSSTSNSDPWASLAPGESAWG